MKTKIKPSGVKVAPLIKFAICSLLGEQIRVIQGRDAAHALERNEAIHGKADVSAIPLREYRKGVRPVAPSAPESAPSAPAPAPAPAPDLKQALIDAGLTSAAPAPLPVAPLSKGALGQILGHSVISVMRAMGRAGWDYKRIRRAVDALNIPAAERTIRGAIRRGRAGQKRIAPLTAEQLSALDVPALTAPPAPVPASA